MSQRQGHGTLPLLRGSADGTTPAATDPTNVAATWHAGDRETRYSPKLPFIARPRGAERLLAKRVALENADALAGLRRGEASQRAMLLASEYERRHGLEWRHRAAVERRRRCDVTANARAAAAEQLSYATRVLLFREAGRVASAEADAREALLVAEGEDRAHAAALLEAALLQCEAERLAAAEEEAAAAYKDMAEVRATQDSQRDRFYRPPKSNLSVIDRFVADALTGEPAVPKVEGSATPSPEYLMSYAVNEEEFAQRQQLRYEEMLSRLLMDHEFSAMYAVAAREALGRRALWATFAAGTCQARLSAVLRVQSWWRLARQQPFALRSRAAVAAEAHACRDARTAAEWARRVATMAATGRRREDDDGLPRDWAAELRRLEAAATLPSRYAAALDYYLFTATERVAAFADCERRDLAARAIRHPLEPGMPAAGTVAADDAVVARDAQTVENVVYLRGRPIIPHSVFFLTSQRRVDLYCQWRRNRWLGGSLRHIAALAASAADEAAARQSLERLRAVDRGSLEAFAAALRSVTVPQHRLTVAGLVAAEACDRAVAENDAAEGRGLLAVSLHDGCWRIEDRARPFAVLAIDEALARTAVEADEAGSPRDAFAEGHWRWANVARRRQQLAGRYTTVRGWRLAVRGGGVGAKFVSVDSAVRVVQRFATGPVRRWCAARDRSAEVARRAVAAGEANPAADARLRALSAVLTTQLAALQAEVPDQQPCPVHYPDDDAEKIARASAVAALRYGAWFDLEAEQPRERRYKEILARFHCLHGDFYRSLNFLLVRYRAGHHRIADDEAAERAGLHHRPVYKKALVYSVTAAERRARMYRDAEEADARDQLAVDRAAGREVVAWGVRAKAVPAAVAHTRAIPPVLVQAQALVLAPAPSPAAARLPALTPLQRLLSREEVRRCTVGREGLRGLVGHLAALSLSLRGAIAAHEAEQLEVVCASIDDRYRRSNPPVCRLALLRSREAAGRAALAGEASAVAYASPLLRTHCMLERTVLWPQFLMGQLSLSSNGAYMDRRLLALLTQRVGSMMAKLDDLVGLEAAARSRIDHLEGITRELRFIYSKLP